MSHGRVNAFGHWPYQGSERVHMSHGGLNKCNGRAFHTAIIESPLCEPVQGRQSD
jgi:hypothetical protein